MNTETLDALQTVLATLPGPGYRAVSASYPAPDVGGMVTITVSVGGPPEDEDENR